MTPNKGEANDTLKKAEAKAEQNPIKEHGEDDPSDLSKFRVYVLILGIDPDCLTKYVEEVMVAKSHLVKMGWNVAGAFIQR